MNKYSDAIVSSSISYLYNLQYLARNDENTLTDLFDLQVINSVYEWAIWKEKSELDKVKLEKIMSSIINRNSNLTFIKTEYKNYYRNVNSEQTLYTWQRIYDNFNVVTHDTL